MKILLVAFAVFIAALAYARPSLHDDPTAASHSAKGAKDGGTDDEEDRA